MEKTKTLKQKTAFKDTKFANFFSNIGHKFVDFHKRFVDGSLGTKFSYFILGSGNLFHKQFIKGFIYLILQILYILFMVLCPEVNGTPFGYKALINLELQGTEGGMEIINGRPVKTEPSNSMLMLLFGIVTLGITIVYIILWLSNTKSSYESDIRVQEGKKPKSFVDDWHDLLDSKFHVLMITPTCIAALIFTVLPTIFMISMAFTTNNKLDMSSQDTNLFHWNGFNNFVYIFTGGSNLGREIKARFLPVFGWTIIWAIFATFTCYFGGILLALLINKKGIKGKKVFRTIFIITIALPSFISLLSVRNLLSASGPINSMLMRWGWIDHPIPWLGLEVTGNNPALAKTMIILINMWVGIPYTMLMTSGILMNIPEDLYEAATVDGASKGKIFFKITLPYVIFVTTPYLISSFVGNINSFNIIYLLTGGGPGVTNGTYVAGETDLLVTWLYKLTIDNGDYNTGAVIGIFTFIITATITLITYRRSKAYKEEDTFQ